MSSLNISSTQLAANNLNYAAMIFVRCYCYIVMPLGIVGHSLSIYVFTRPTLLTNPCSIYFLAATVVGLVNTCYTLPMRMVQAGFPNTDPGGYSSLFCKLAWFSLYSIRGLCPWLVVLACFDRYLSSSTSTGKRAWSAVRIAYRIVPLTVLMGFIIHIHVLIFFQINIIPATQKPICYPPGPPGTYRIVLSFFNLVYFGLSPSFCMFLLGMLTLRNIERSKRLLVSPTTNLDTRTSQNNRKINRQMLRMLFLQVLVYSVTSAAYSVTTIYTGINATQPKDVFQVAQDSMITAALGMLTNSGPCLSFYLFTLSSGLFRKELKKLLNKFIPAVNRSHDVPTQLGRTERRGMTTKV